MLSLYIELMTEILWRPGLGAGRIPLIEAERRSQLFGGPEISPPCHVSP